MDVEAAYAAVHAERIDLQLAADQAYPHYDPANSAIRRDFHLPPTAHPWSGRHRFVRQTRFARRIAK